MGGSRINPQQAVAHNPPERTIFIFETAVPSSLKSFCSCRRAPKYQPKNQNISFYFKYINHCRRGSKILQTEDGSWGRWYVMIFHLHSRSSSSSNELQFALTKSTYNRETQPFTQRRHQNADTCWNRKIPSSVAFTIFSSVGFHHCQPSSFYRLSHLTSPSIR